MNYAELKNSAAARIRALLAKTVANGATEAEAFAAAEKARELLAKYQLDMSDIEIRAEGVDQWSTMYASSYERAAAMRIAMGVAAYTQTKCWASNRRRGITFLGLKSDVIFAEWLMETLIGYCRRSAEEYVKTGQGAVDAQVYGTAPTKTSFIKACASRIGTRLNEEAKNRFRHQAAPAGYAVALRTKDAMITEEMAKMNLRLRAGRTTRNYHKGGSGAAGNAAGDRASWSKPVNGGAGTLALK